MSKQTGISNRLLGRVVRPHPEIGSWYLAPDVDGGQFGTIEAVWLDSDGNLKIQVRGPKGDGRATWLDHVLLDEGEGESSE